MEVYVKETLHVLDYDNNIKDTIFISDDHRTAGYAYNINITEANTGYSDLTFDMPNTIIDEDGNQLKNPKLALLTPLVKLRYNRTVYYMGEKEITVREPIGCGDKVEYKDVTYSNTYPNNIIENYVMDYIVQPVDKKRSSLTITTSFTAIDYPRFTLSKKKVGLNISNETITKPEWSLFQNKPMDQAGLIKYVKWTSDLSAIAKGSSEEDIPVVWDAEHANDYPLNKENISLLMTKTEEWPYGLLATAFYWPITSTGRVNGVLYKEGGFLVLQLYDFYNLTSEGIDPETFIDPELNVDRYSWEWSQLYKMESYLAPNNAKNYLSYILEGTNWKVGEVDLETVDITKPDGAIGTLTETAQKTCAISVDGSNCYNAITAICQGLQLYPVFDCINQTVSLKIFAGKNYGLTYRLGNNISENNIKSDGEKIITKLYCTGGTDTSGSAKINIGDANRSYVKMLNGFYSSADDLPIATYDVGGEVINDVEGYWAIVDNGFTSSDFEITRYKIDEDVESETYGQLISYTDTTHDILVNNYWNVGENRQVYAYDNQANSWSLGTKEESGYWSIVVNGKEYLVDPKTGTQPEWDPNDDMYISARSPYGTNYIINLKWAYQNNWITQEEILELYQYNLQIQNLNKAFINKYKDDLVLTQQAYYDAVNNYDIAQDGYQSTLNAMENKYYINGGDYSKGTRYCFHTAPQGTYTKEVEEKVLHYIKIHHCYKCGNTIPIAPIVKENADGSITSTPGSDITVCTKEDCGSTDVVNNEIYIPVYSDWNDWTVVESMYTYGENDGESPEYDPHLKGYYQRLVSSLDRATVDANWTIADYEKVVSMIEPIQYQGDTATFDGFEYVIKGIYVRSTSGQIEVWNEAIDDYIKNYGLMLNYLRDVNANLEKIEKLQELYDAWDAIVDGINLTIQEKYGDFLIEGNYNDEDQPYVNLLFANSLEASDKFSVPEITYNLNVIDSSGLAEYREPQLTKYRCNNCYYTAYNYYEICPKCKSSNILREHDIYNDLVHMLHSVGQIIPKAGDYVTIYDEPMGMYGISALITEVQRVLDDPVQNKIQLDTSYTDDEELVGNIITATNTVLNNSDIYARTAIIKGDGTIDSSSIQTSIDNPNANITIVGTNGNILLSGSGLRATDPNDGNRAMKYTGTGVFKTTNLQDGEAVSWEKMMTPDGIIATYLNAGTIDTNKLTITSGLNGTVMIDQYGLGVKKTPSKSLHITNFDKEAAKTIDGYASKWGNDNNIATFVGVDRTNQPLIYTQGFLVAENGSNIGGWITSKDGDNKGLYHLKSGTTNGTKDLWLSPDGISGTVNNNTKDYSLYVNGNFGVTTDGRLHATGADIKGSIYATSLKLDSTSTVEGLSYNDLDNTPDLTVYIQKDGTLGTVANGSTGFKVSRAGLLQASNAVIYGTIYASNGTFSGTVTASNGNIGNWSLNSRVYEADAKRNLYGLTAYNTLAAVEVSYDGKYTGMKSSSGSAFYAGASNPANGGGVCAFSVSHTGHMQASDVSITGGTISLNGITMKTGTISVRRSDGLTASGSGIFVGPVFISGGVSGQMGHYGGEARFYPFTDLKGKWTITECSDWGMIPTPQTPPSSSV